MLRQSPIIAGAMLASISAAHAGSPGAVSVVPPPPAGYDATRASAGINGRYAVPPEPDAAAAPRAHAAWTRAMHSVGRRASVTITPTKRRHTPIANKHAVAESNGIISVESANWSGTSIAGYPAAGLRAVTGMFVVPEAHQAKGECGAPKWASIWPGIDGNGSSDVLQAGVNAVALCVIDFNTGQGSVVGDYSPWIEWYPNYETELSSPAINPGDLVFVEVWNTSPTQGYAYFYNYTTDESAEYSITAPLGTALQDTSVEWIVERPEGGGVLTPLTNYVAMPWAEGVAWNYAASPPTTYLLAKARAMRRSKISRWSTTTATRYRRLRSKTTSFCGSKTWDHPAAAAASRPAERLNQTRLGTVAARGRNARGTRHGVWPSNK